MNKHHEVALQEAREWLANVDADEFLNEFLELQGQTCGPTVDEFMATLHVPTYALFGLSNEDYWLSPYTDFVSLNLSDNEIKRILEQFKTTLLHCKQRCANDETYGLKHPKLHNYSDSFICESLDEDDFLAA